MLTEQVTNGNQERGETMEPDTFDLNDWLLLTEPETHAALKYLHPDTWAECARKIWTLKGCPAL